MKTQQDIIVEAYIGMISESDVGYVVPAIDKLKALGAKPHKTVKFHETSFKLNHDPKIIKDTMTENGFSHTGTYDESHITPGKKIMSFSSKSGGTADLHVQDDKAKFLSFNFRKMND
jgi:hypothetical protein